MSSSYRPTVLRPSSLTDLVSVVPVLLGFHPQESLVAISAHGPRHRLGLSLRVDLPEPGQDAALAAVVGEVVGHLVRQDPAGVLLVVYSGCEPTATAVLEAVRASLDDADVPVLEAARSNGSRIWSTTCPDERCCPPDGVPYDPAASPVVTAAVVEGHEILPDRWSLVERWQPVAQPTDGVRAATAEVEAEVEARGAGLLRPSSAPAVVSAGWAATRDVLGRCAGGTAPSDRDVAVLSVWTGTPTVRDLLWAGITRVTARDQLTTWREAGRRALPAHRAPVLTLAAFAAWMCGTGAQAVTGLELALAHDPDDRLAALLLSAVTGGIDPRQWIGFGEEEIVRSVPGLAALQPPT